MKFTVSLCAFTLIAFCHFSPVVAQLDHEARPPTQELLPETTVAFVQVDNFPEMIEKLQSSFLGDLLKEESVVALEKGLWEETKLAYENIESDVGLKLEDFTSLLAGEITVAAISPRRKDLEFMVILELNESSEAFGRVINRGLDFLENEAIEYTSETSEEDGIVYKTFSFQGKRIKFFQLDDLLVASTSESELDAFVDRWAGRGVKKTRPLTSNRKFFTLMKRCLEGGMPEARLFVDPIALTISNARGNSAAQNAFSVLPALGLDGLLGIGGSILLPEDDFEFVFHSHVLLASPRAGIFRTLALKPITSDPEPWMPVDAASYITTNWDIGQALSELTKMSDDFAEADEDSAEIFLLAEDQEAGEQSALEQWAKMYIEGELGLDLKKDVLNHLTGRVTYCRWMEPQITRDTPQPTTEQSVLDKEVTYQTLKKFGIDLAKLALNSQVNMIALEVENLKEFEMSVETAIAKLNRGGTSDQPAVVKEFEHKGVRIWALPAELIGERLGISQIRYEEAPSGTRGEQDLAFLPEHVPAKFDASGIFADGNWDILEPSFALVGNYLLISPQSRLFIERAIDTNQGQVEPLSDDPGFQVVSNKIGTLLKSKTPCGMMYASSEELFRMLSSNSNATQAILSRMTEDSDYFTGIVKRFNDSSLEGSEDIKKYFKRLGGYAVSDQKGYHFQGFVLRGDREDDDQ